MYQSVFAEIEICYRPHIEVFKPALTTPSMCTQRHKTRKFWKFFGGKIFLQFSKQQKVTKCAIRVHVWSGRSGMSKPYPKRFFFAKKILFWNFFFHKSLKMAKNTVFFRVKFKKMQGVSSDHEIQFFFFNFLKVS